MVITERSDGTDAENYLHKDHLGSTISVTDKNGAVVQQFTYDPCGKQTKIYQHSTFNNLTFNQPTNRGYTGHEHIDGLDIIHMNGRIYDADLGRFMQADPNIQSPGNFQNYNRYSYVLNNPLRYTDPSGLFFKDLVKAEGFLAGSSGGGALGGILQGYINHNVHKFIANSQTLTQTGALAVGAVTAWWCGPCSIGFSALYTSNMA